MGSEARNHHYISQGYLRGFAKNRRGNKPHWFTHVSDFSQLRMFEVNVKSICSQRDFNRVEVPGNDPNIVESQMAGFESQCIEALRRVAETGDFRGEDANLTLNFMALLAVRSPEQRENMRDFHERVRRNLLSTITATKQIWDSVGGDPSTQAEYEAARDFATRGEYTVAVPREHHLKTEFELMNTVLECLGQRSWTVYKVDGSYGEFVTTDRPVALSFIDPDSVPAIWRHSPGFALRNTEVHFPLTRHAVLVGRWDGRAGSEVGSQQFVAAVNVHMMKHSFSRAFSASKEILYHGPSLEFHWDQQLIERFKGWRG